MSPSSIDFATLGMFIVDDIYPAPSSSNQTPQLDIIGGAGTYSAVGARLLTAPSRSEAVGWIVDAGTDFSDEHRQIIDSWKTGVVVRPRAAPTTRGWNGYSDNEFRAFKYLTEKKRLKAEDLTSGLLASKSFHLICHPLRCIEQITGILDKRKEAFGTDMPRPIFIWEPVPDLCTPAELENTYAALHYVDVISPNHDELASFFGFTHPAQIDRAAIEDQAQRLLKPGTGNHRLGAVVVRAGASGCFVLTHSENCWLPAYHDDPRMVIDPTGGGNGFLGGLAVGLVNTDSNVVEAARWGSVAASFCIEQVGMPHLDISQGSQYSELWNSESVLERLTSFRQRTTRE